MGSRFRRGLIISSAIIAGSFLISGVAVYLIGLDLRLQADKIGTARALIANHSAVLASLAHLKNDAAQAASYKTALDKVLVSQNQLLDFKKWVDGLARTNGLEHSFSFQGEPVLPSGDSPGYYNFSLDASGPQRNLAEFMETIEYRSPRFLSSLSSFNLTRSGDNYRISTQGNVYFR